MNDWIYSTTRTENTKTQNPTITRHSTQGNNKISYIKTKHHKNRELIWPVWILGSIVELGQLQATAQGNNKIYSTSKLNSTNIEDLYGQFWWRESMLSSKLLLRSISYQVFLNTHAKEREWCSNTKTHSTNLLRVPLALGPSSSWRTAYWRKIF